MSKLLNDAIFDLLQIIESEREDLNQKEAMLAAAAEIRLEDPAIDLKIAEAVCRERLRFELLIEKQLAWVHPSSNSASILQILKKQITDDTVCGLDR